MAEQRQKFRNWFPWMQAPPARHPPPARRPPPPPPPPSPPPAAVPTAESQIGPTQSTTTTNTAQQPPFRPPGLASPQAAPPPQAQASPRTESQPPSPPNATARSRVTSQPPSPSRTTAQSRGASQPPSPSSRAATQSRGASQPPSPSSRAATQSRGAAQPPSPSRLATQSQAATQPPSPSLPTPQSQAAPQPLSPSRTSAETQPASQAAPQPQSPPKLASQPSVQTSSLPPSPSLSATPAQSAQEAVTQPPLPLEKLQPTTQEGFEPPPGSTEPPTSLSREEPKPTRTQPESQELQPKAERTSDNVLNVQNQTHSRVTFQPNGMPAQPSEVPAPVMTAAPTATAAEQTPAPSQKSDSSLVVPEIKSLQESGGNPGETLEGKEILQEHGSREKTNGVTQVPKQRTATEILNAAPDSKDSAKMHPSVAFDAEQKQLEKEEVSSRKETIANSGSHGKQTEVVISNLRDKNTASESRHKHSISNGEGASLHKEIRDDISKFTHEMATHQQKHPFDERSVSVITVAGENRGASMQLGSESGKREGAVHIRRGYKINPDDSTEATTDGEGSSKGRRSQDSETEEDQESKAYINSNVQGINNSLMFSSSITERNPGVQLVLSRNLKEPVKLTRTMDSIETHKDEFNVTPAQKLTYDPTVRRRCLRGLFMEPSDSDPDNPEKPRRHGCRYACKDNEIDVL